LKCYPPPPRPGQLVQQIFLVVILSLAFPSSKPTVYGKRGLSAKIIYDYFVIGI